MSFLTPPLTNRVATPGDDYHLAALREAWRHFDGAMMIDRPTASPALLGALRAFIEATILLKREFEAFRRAQFLRAEKEKGR